LTKLLTRGIAQAANGPLQDTLTTASDQIDSLIVIDRRVDMLSPLLTQLTYEGLIDELVGIKNCKYTDLSMMVVNNSTLAHVLLPASFLQPSKAPGQQNPATSPQDSTTPLPTISVAKEQKKKYRLSSETDPLFGELRDLNFAAVGKRLSKTTHQLKEDYDVCLTLSSSSTDLKSNPGSA
jgi:hypothetical protein